MVHWSLLIAAFIAGGIVGTLIMTLVIAANDTQD